MTIGDVRGVGSQPEPGRISGADTSQAPKEEKVQPEIIVKDEVAAKDWDTKIRLENELRDLKERLGDGNTATWKDKEGAEYSLIKHKIAGTGSTQYILVRQDNERLVTSTYREGANGLIEGKDWQKLMQMEGKPVQVGKASIKAEPNGKMLKEETPEAIAVDPKTLEGIGTVVKIANHPLAKTNPELSVGVIASKIKTEEFARGPVLRKAEEGEVNKSNDGKVVINGQVLNVDFVPLEYASAGLLGFVDAVMKRADNDPEKALLNEKIQAANVKVKEFLSNHPEVKDDKEIKRKLFVLNLSGGILAEVLNKGPKADIVSPALFSNAAQFYAVFNEEAARSGEK